MNEVSLIVSVASAVIALLSVFVAVRSVAVSRGRLHEAAYKAMLDESRAMCHLALANPDNLALLTELIHPEAVSWEEAKKRKMWLAFVILDRFEHRHFLSRNAFRKSEYEEVFGGATLERVLQDEVAAWCLERGQYDLSFLHACKHWQSGAAGPLDCKE